jgi:hypothetical protein
MTGSRRSFIAGAFGSLMLGSVLGDTPADRCLLHATSVSSACILQQEVLH